MLENPITWVYLSFGLAGVAVILIVALVAGYMLTKPIIVPYLKCRNKSKTPLMAIFQRNGRVRLVPGRYVAEMYEDPDPKNPLAFFKSDTGGYKLGGCDIEPFYDGAIAATSPDLVVAVQELRKMGYRTIDEVMAAIRAGRFKGDKFEMKGETVSFTDGTISIPLIRQFDPAQVDIFGKGKPAITKAYSDTKLNIDRASRNEKFYENPQLMGMAFILLMGCLGIGLMKALGVF
jgi:hypothetical protein